MVNKPPPQVRYIVLFFFLRWNTWSNTLHASDLTGHGSTYMYIDIIMHMIFIFKYISCQIGSIAQWIARLRPKWKVVGSITTVDKNFSFLECQTKRVEKFCLNFQFPSLQDIFIIEHFTWQNNGGGRQRAPGAFAHTVKIMFMLVFMPRPQRSAGGI